MTWQPLPFRSQEPLTSQPYDLWVSPNGAGQAEFHRTPEGHLIRFPGQADFLIEHADQQAKTAIRGWPASDGAARAAETLYHNAILPIVGNHQGGLFLHGSAVELGHGADRCAIAFLGLSRSGKTTLAGAFAKAGYRFLTEDVIDLRIELGTYWLQPKRSTLRLFADSAAYLLGRTASSNMDEKHEIEAGQNLPFARDPAPLRQIYVLGEDHSARTKIAKHSSQSSLAAIMPHAFVLDVEDKERLNGHFVRMADLAEEIGCFTLDYPRQYSELPGVIEAVLANSEPRA